MTESKTVDEKEEIEEEVDDNPYDRLEGGEVTTISPEQLSQYKSELEGSEEVTGMQQVVALKTEKLETAQRELDEAKTNLTQARSKVISAQEQKEERLTQLKKDQEEALKEAKQAEAEAKKAEKEAEKEEAAVAKTSKK